MQKRLEKAGYEDPNALEFLYYANANSINFASSLTSTNDQNSFLKLKQSIINDFNGISNPFDENKIISIVVIQRLLKVKDFPVFKFVSETIPNYLPTTKFTSAYDDDIVLSAIKLKTELLSDHLLSRNNDESISKKLKVDEEDYEENYLKQKQICNDIKQESDAKSNQETEPKKIKENSLILLNKLIIKYLLTLLEVKFILLCI